MGCQNNLVELLLYALAADDLQSVGVAREGLACFLLNLKVELGGEAHAAHHAQRVVAEGNVGIEGCGDDAILQVGHTVEGVDELAEAVAIEAHCHGVDGEVATVLVVFEGTVFHVGLPTVMAIALLAGAHKLHLQSAAFHLRRAEVAEHRQVGSSTQHALQA